MTLRGKDFCRMLDATQIGSCCTKDDMEKLIALAHEHHFFSVIGPRCFVPLLAAGVRGSDTIAGSGCCTDTGCEPGYLKAHAALDSLRLGAGEIDMVMNLHYFKSGMYQEVVEDIRAVKEAVGDHVLKCIIEVPLLDDGEIKTAAELVVEGGADFVKTATGTIPQPTTVHQVELIAKAVRGRAQIKAAGGIRTLQTVEEMIGLGVTRFGVSVGSALKIMEAADAR
ncbi:MULTISPECIES: deoxyribose-phosphate aldolase [Oscillospiraceae]|nr:MULTISPECIES: deoxyribose-phosphate aldolase [Oscillospiraceae]